MVRLAWSIGGNFSLVNVPFFPFISPLLIKHIHGPVQLLVFTPKPSFLPFISFLRPVVLYINQIKGMYFIRVRCKCRDTFLSKLAAGLLLQEASTFCRKIYRLSFFVVLIVALLLLLMLQR